MLSAAITKCPILTPREPTVGNQPGAYDHFNDMQTKKEKLKKMPHIISGVLILLHGLERFDSGNGDYPVFLLAGIVFLGVALFHKKISRPFPTADVIFYAVEGLLSFLVAYEYWCAGKRGLPIAYIVAGIFQLVAICIFVSRARVKAE